MTNNSVEFTLKEFSNVGSNNWNARFEVRTNGQPDSSWQIAGIHATDATGNLVSTRGQVIAAARKEPLITLNGALWRSERAWRISADFCRAFDFRTNEMWTTPQIALPFIRTSGTTNLSLTNVVLGCTLVLGELHASFNPIDPGHAGSRLILTAWLRDMPAPCRLFLVEAVDDLRQEITIRQVDSYAVGWHTFSLLVPTHSKTAQFTFAVRRTTSVAFDVANPASPRL